MVEHLELQRGEIGPGVDAELVVEMAPDLMVRGERIGLPTAPVQRDHQQLPQPLPQRIALRRHAKIRRDLRVATSGQQRPKPLLDHRRPYLVQPCRRACHPPLARKVREDRATPQRERLVKDRHRRRRITPGEPVPLSCETLEHHRVDIVAPGAQHVPGRLADKDRRRRTRQAFRLESTSQIRHIHVQRPRRPSRRLIPPHVVNQTLSRHHPIDLQQQQRQHRSLTRLTEIDRRSVVTGRHKRAEQTKAHPRSLTAQKYLPRQRLRRCVRISHGGYGSTTMAKQHCRSMAQ